MMTGYIHTVYPAGQREHEDGLALKVVGVIDTDVSTGVAGRIGPKPDMLPMTVRVKTGRYADARDVQRPDGPGAGAAAVADDVGAHQRDRHRGQPARGADRARLRADVKLKDQEPIVCQRHLQRPAVHRAVGRHGAVRAARRDRQHPGPQPDGPGADRVDRLRRGDRAGPQGRRRSSRSGCVRHGRARQGPEGVRHAQAVQGRTRDRRDGPADPGRFPRGDVTRRSSATCPNSVRRRFRNEPTLAEPRDLQAILKSMQLQIEPKRTGIYAHVPAPERGLAVARSGTAEPAGQRPGRLRLASGRSRPRRSAPT